MPSLIPDPCSVFRTRSVVTMDFKQSEKEEAMREVRNEEKANKDKK
jgi:hypothetical protein